MTVLLVSHIKPSDRFECTRQQISKDKWNLRLNMLCVTASLISLLDACRLLELIEFAFEVLDVFVAHAFT